MTFSDFYIRSLLLGQQRAVEIADSRGLNGPQIVRLIQRTEQRRLKASAK